MLTPTKAAPRPRKSCFRTLVESALEAIAVHRHGVLIYVNPATIKLLGAQSAQDLIGKPILDLVHPDFRQIVRARVKNISAQNTTTTMVEQKFLRLDGTVVDVAVQSTWITYGAEPAIQVAIRDITPLIAQRKQLEQVAHFDALTNLPNRVLLADRLLQAMTNAQRRHQPLAVVFLDLDGFKTINDRDGHEAGDHLLVAISARMKQALREGDTLARFGGDEFVAVLLDLPDVRACEPMLKRLLAAAAEPVQFGDIALQVSVSIGITFFPQEHGLDADQLLRQADHAMYLAKVAGKNRYSVFDAELDLSLRSHQENIERIRHALVEHEFVLYYQPKVNMRTGTVVGAETLLRWQHPVKGLLAPDTFLPLIENTALAVEIGEWVIDGALTQMELWLADGFDIALSVNIGTRQLQQSDFAARLQMLLAAHPRVKPASLELEVLERSAPQELTGVAQTLQACREMGVSIALSDFGTGNASLAYLQSMPVNLLKVDRSFVHDMLDGPDDLAILEGVIGLAVAFRRQIIAEGVESAEHGAMLLQLGCDLAQGYGIARPMPAHELPAWSAQWRNKPSWGNQAPLSRKALLEQFKALV